MIYYMRCELERLVYYTNKIRYFLLYYITIDCYFYITNKFYNS